MGSVSGSQISVVLADDHAVVRSALRALLDAEEDLEVAGEASDADGALSLLSECAPDVLVLDLRMPGPDPITLLGRLAGDHPDTAVVILTVETDPSLVEACLDAGAAGYVLKQASEVELGEAIRSAVTGGRFVSSGARAAQAEPPGDLTAREAEVLGLIALGHTNSEVAVRLGLSVRTVESHRLHIQQKTGLSSRPELVRYALANGLISSPGS